VGYSSPSLAQLVKEEFFNDENSSWFASTLVLGQICGSICGPILADKVGRRKGCAIGAFFSIFGWSLLGVSSSERMLLVGRFITGFFDCLSVPIGIMFVSEVSEVRLKGSFLNSSAVASGFGIALAYFAGSVFYWRYACLLPICHNVLALSIFYISQESPVFLLTKKQSAKEALQWYRETRQNTKEIVIDTERELENMEIETACSDNGSKESFKKLFQAENLKPFLILATLFFLYPLTGMYSIAFFAIDLFEKLKLGNAGTVAILSALIRCMGTAVSSVLIFKYGRRKIMLISTTLVCLTIGLVGMFVVLNEGNWGFNETLLSWVLVILIFLFMFNVGLAISNLPWVLMAEWFTPDLKSIVSGTLITQNFVMIFLAVQTTHPILQLVGTSGLFVYFCAVCAVKTVFIAIFVPETHGKLYSSMK